MAWLRYLMTILVGLALGLVAAVHTVRAGALGSNISIGPWRTGLDFGAAAAGAKTRAVVALRGLLALPAREARYYTAATDTAGQPLDGRCRYRVTGGPQPGRWWSLTLYDRDGYLVRNRANIFSVESAAITPAERANWTIAVAPTRQPGHWLPTGGLDHVELTLRAYLPVEFGNGKLLDGDLPTIVKEGC